MTAYEKPRLLEPTMTKLLPCPFCGGPVKTLIGPFNRTTMFICDRCGADVCFYGAEHGDKAIAAWNRRAE